jgi:hypothetical protein
MYLIELNNKINKAAWHSEDVTWLRARKKSWKNISAQLRKHKALRPKDLKYYQNYYLTGELYEEADELNYPPTVNATILMMFHPDQTETNLLSIYNEYCILFREVRSDSALEFFFHELSFCDYGAEGILGGNESLYCRLLCGTTSVDFSNLFASKNPAAFPGYCQKLIPFLLDDESYKYEARQYLTDFYFYTAENARFDFGANPLYIGQFLQIICYYELLDPFKGVSEERHLRAWTLVNKVRDKLTESDLPKPLLELWQHIQTEDGKHQVFEYFQEKYSELRKITNN